MYVYSRKSLIYHHEHCSYAKRILSCNKGEFADEAQACDAGYRVCGCCGTMKKHVRRQMPTLHSLCAARRIRLVVCDQAIYFKTSRSWWKIKATPGGLILCHENTRYIAYNRETTPCHRREYHVQDCRRSNAAGYLNYIADHDRWRNAIENPRTKKQKHLAKKAEMRRRRNAVARVHQLLDNLSASARPPVPCATTAY